MRYETPTLERDSRSTRIDRRGPRVAERRPRGSRRRTAEVSLLVPPETATALQAAANGRGLSVAELIRRLVGEFPEGCHESRVLDHCRLTFDVESSDEHAAIGNWLNEGGSVLPTDS